MPFQLSPGVAVVEKDFSAIIPAVSTSAGAFAGTFVWGPVLDPVTITSENVLVSRFGKPNDATAQSFFTAANFLAYTNNLLVTRVDAPDAKNAVASETGHIAAITFSDHGEGYEAVPTVTISAPDVSGGIQATVKDIQVVDGGVYFQLDNAGTGYTNPPTITISPSGVVNASAEATIALGGVKINNFNDYTMDFSNGEGVVGEWAAKYPGTLGNSLTVSMADQTTFEGWEYAAQFDGAPNTSAYATSVSAANDAGHVTNDELHIVVVDTNGLWTGVAGTVLEKFAFVSKASDCKKSDGTNNYYKNVINANSKYIWWMDHTASVLNTANAAGSDAASWGTTVVDAASTTIGGFKDLSDVVTTDLVGGEDDWSPTDGNLIDGFAIYQNAEQYDVSLIPTGPANAIVSKWVVENVAQERLDCVVFVSPTDINNGGPIIGSGSDAANAVVAFRNDASFDVNSSYAVLDSGYKYQYDRYNDKYRWVPLNGDIAGLCARTDYTNDPWWSPGGLNRGQVKNVVRLAFNPGKTERDTLYKAGVNPVVTFPGQGTVLYGDKTLQAKPSAFDRINVRRLFIVLEKAIATASKYQLFEFNDSFTRAQFTNLVTPFLRDVQGRRGIIDFRVVCNDTNNTGEVIDRNEFVADIYIKPARSINFITLNFIAARTSVNFEEIGA